MNGTIFTNITFTCFHNKDFRIKRVRGNNYYSLLSESPCFISHTCERQLNSPYVHQHIPRKRLQASSCFRFRMGGPSCAILTDWLRQILATAGEHGNCRSFRIGAATMAAHYGVPDHLI